MSKTKLFLGKNSTLEDVQRWANTVEEKIEVKSLDEPKTMYVSIRTTTTPPQLVLFEKRGDVDVEIGTIDITV